MNYVYTLYFFCRILQCYLEINIFRLRKPAYTVIFFLFTDPRSASWPLMSSPWAMAAISAGYLWIVTQSPSWLANQKPMQLRPIMVVYNLFMSLLSLYMAVEVRHDHHTNIQFNKLFLIFRF